MPDRSSKGLKILIIGAGAVGSVVARQLARERNVAKVTCIDRDVRRARAFLKGCGKKVRLVKGDVRTMADIERVGKGSTIIVNAGLPVLNRVIMGGALRVGAHYQDMCSHLADLKNAEQLRFHKDFKAAGLRALFNTGVAPGITNLLAADLAEQFDEVDEVRFRLIEDQDATRPIFTWSPTVLFDELMAPPLVYRDRRFRLIEPFSELETYDFPQPFGARRVYSIYGDEVATLPRYLRCRAVDMKSGGADIDFGAALYHAGVLSTKRVTFRGRRLVPFDFFARLASGVPTPEDTIALVRDGVVRNAYLVVSVEVTGTARRRKRRSRITAVYPNLKEILRRAPGATYISWPTAISAVAFTRALMRYEQPGVIPPEALPPELRARVRHDLEARGVSFEESSSTVRASRRRAGA